MKLQEGNLQHITQFISNDGGNGVVNLQRTRGRDDLRILSLCTSFFFLKPEPTSQDSNHSFLWVFVCSACLYSTHLLFIQRYDHWAVAELGLADHRLGELNLGRDVGHRYGIVVVIGDVQCALDGRRQTCNIICQENVDERKKKPWGHLVRSISWGKHSDLRSVFFIYWQVFSFCKDSQSASASVWIVKYKLCMVTAL